MGHYHPALTQPTHHRAPLVLQPQHAWEEAEELHWACGTHRTRPKSPGCSIHVEHPQVGQTLLVGAIL